MTYDEALAILGPACVARIRARRDREPKKPLSEEQIALLVAQLGDLPDETVDAA